MSDSMQKDNNTLDNPLRRLWLLCRRTCNMYSRCEEAIFSRAGITPQQVGVLEALKYGEETMTMSRVAGFLDRDISAITMTVNRMELAGLAVRNRDLKDRRAVRLVATEKGKQAYAEAEKIGFNFITSALCDFPESDLEQAARYIERIKQSAQRELNNHKKK